MTKGPLDWLHHLFVDEQDDNFINPREVEHDDTLYTEKTPNAPRSSPKHKRSILN